MSRCLPRLLSEVSPLVSYETAKTDNELGTPGGSRVSRGRVARGLGAGTKSKGVLLSSEAGQTSGHNHRSGVRRPHGSRYRPAPRNLQRPWRAAPSRLGVPCGLVSTSVHSKRRSRLRAVGRPTAGARVPATGVRAASPGPECGSDFPVCGVGPRGRAVSLLCAASAAQRALRPWRP